MRLSLQALIDQSGQSARVVLAALRSRRLKPDANGQYAGVGALRAVSRYVAWADAKSKRQRHDSKPSKTHARSA